MTPDQRLKRAERILLTMIKSGRRTRSEWRYKINSLIDAQIRHETVWRIESETINKQLKEVAVAQVKNEKSIADLTRSQKLSEKSIADLARSQKLTEKSIAGLARSQKLTDKALRTFIESLRKCRNGQSSN